MIHEIYMAPTKMDANVMYERERFFVYWQDGIYGVNGH